jgi:hypothetical protein
LFLSAVQPVGHEGFFSKEQINMLTMEQGEDFRWLAFAPAGQAAGGD